MKKALLLATCLLLASHAFAQAPHTLTGNVQPLKGFTSSYLAPERSVMVYLPPGYDAPENQKHHYPVLYLADGQNVFDGATSFIPGQEWQVDESAEAGIKVGKVEPLIIVSVANAGATRHEEYTPYRDAKYGGGKADAYAKFLINDLKPYIDKTYRTKKDATDTGIGGSSLGGLLSAYLGLTYPAVFGRVLIVSPSVWWADKALLKTVEALPKKLPLRVYIDIGTAEGDNADTDARALRDAFFRKGWAGNGDLLYVEAPGAKHNEAAWAARVPKMLEFLYPVTEK